MRTIIPKKAVTVPAGAEKVFTGIIYDVYHWQQQLFDGTTTTFEMLKRPDTVKTLAVKDDKLVVLEQEQPNQKVFYDIPGGAHDQESETELEAAKRELREETGLTSASWRLLSVRQPNPKIDQLVYTFLATDCMASGMSTLDSGEKIKIMPLPFGEAKEILSSPRARFSPADLENVESLDALLSKKPYDEFS